MAKTPLPFKFDGTNPEAQAAANAAAAKLVVEVSDETIAALRALIARSIREGMPPREVARVIQGMVGLDTRRALAALNFRQALIEQGLPLARIDVLTERFIKKKVRERALMIARTETIDALNAGQQLAWNQAQEEGLLDDGSRQEWIVTPDEILRNCPICRTMDGQLRKFGENFVTGIGTKVRGPSAHVACRCALGVQP